MLSYKQSAIDAFKTTSKGAIQKTAETIDVLIANRIAHIITKVSITLPPNSLEIVINKHYKEIPKERYISQERKQKFF